MAKFKSPFLFSLAIAPVAAIAMVFVCLYQFDLYSPETLALALSQVGSRGALVAVTTVQGLVLVFLCSFFGCVLSEKLGLWKPLRFEKTSTLTTVCLSALAGVVLSLDYWVFGGLIDGIQAADAAGLTASGVIASVLYGGVIEEILMRLLFMSLAAWIIWKLFFRGKTAAELPSGIFIAANIIAALLFAAGHLPSTVTTFGALTPLLLLRCFLLNGGFGLLFGWLYRKYGIWYSMLSHMLAHIVSKLIWFIFI